MACKAKIIKNIDSHMILPLLCNYQWLPKAPDIWDHFWLVWLPSQGADHKQLSLRTENSRAPILSTHSENTAVRVTSECPSQHDASLIVPIGIQCHMMKANNYQDCWKEKDHITLDKANILAVNLCTLRNTILLHGFYTDFLCIKWQGVYTLDFGYCLILKSTHSNSDT